MSIWSRLRKHPYFTRAAGIILAVLFWIFVWWILSRVVNEELLLPAPAVTLNALARLIGTPLFSKTVAVSLLRILFGILSAIVLGVGFGILTGKIRFLDALFSPLLYIVKSVPVASFIVLLVLWLKKDSVPGVIAALMVLPVVWTNVSEGIRNTDPALLEMAVVFRLPFFRKLRRIYLPSVLPYFLSACRSGLGLGWKAGIAAEVIVLPLVSIGRQIWTSSNNLNTADMFAWTLTVLLLSVCADLLVSGLFSLYRKSRARKKGGSADDAQTPDRI